MSYLVLARKWRPRRFAELVGQAHVVRALSHALDSGRVHHALLFTGTRGVGKTTIARIFAKALNCERGASANPCGECGACRDIDAGRFFDLIEIDAASNTGVDDVRELIDNAQYAPARGAHKVYLIDEVHMLSKPAFNALLKTLEEPPPHVKFLLATTDPQKLPVTVLSRCLQFNLRRLTAEEIAGQMGMILEREGVVHDAAALALLARAADGSLRDGLSLLDQAIAHGGGGVRETEVRAMLGSIERGFLADILQALAGRDGRALLEAVARMDEQAPDYTEALADLAALWHRIALSQAVPGMAEAGWDDAATVSRFTPLFAPEEVQLLFQITLQSRRELDWAPSARLGFEMALLRMLAFRPVDMGASPAASGTLPPAAPPRQSAGVAAAAVPAAAGTARAEAPALATAPLAVDWAAQVQAMNLGGVVRTLALHSVPVEQGADFLKLRLDVRQAKLLNEVRRAELEQALRAASGQPEFRLTMEVGAPGAETPAQAAQRERQERQESAVSAIESDPNVQAMQRLFGARLERDAVKPLDS
jgi:DNA polymerase-3 subunit gamma/tau